MKNKIPIFYFSVFFIISFSIALSYAKADLIETTTTTIADKDAYVDSSLPDDNFGETEYMYMGVGPSGSDIKIAYMRFPLSEIPTNWTNAEISFRTDLVGMNINVTIHLITAYWNESRISWNYQPWIDEFMTTLIIDEDREYRINVTSYIPGKDSIAIRINTTSHILGAECRIYGRTTSFSPYKPKIVWTYLTTSTPPNIPGYELISLLSFLSLFSIILLLKRSVIYKFQKDSLNEN